jgi:TonB-linked SusC/RagA family outer membrane protein
MRKLLLLFMSMLWLSGQLFAQNRTITGKVTDATNAPVPNASILVKGTKIGTTTNADGTYTLSVPSSAKVLVFSGVGFGELEVSIGSGSTIDASLIATNRDMQEVVVVGYGSQKRADLTGVVATVKAADIENKPFSSVDKALQGQVAGLQSVASSGTPGASQAILIRGMSSLTASNAPLWVIDGIPVNTGDASRLTTTANLLSTLNPNDIESISVLKDAASASIYGSRAANGVIVVTTKRGRSGKTRFRFDTEVGQNSIAYENDKYRPLNAAEYFAITEEGLNNINAANIPQTLAGLGKGNGVDFNWRDAVIKNGTQQQYNLSAEGGNEKTIFYVSAGYFLQDGTTINSDLRRYNGAFRVQHKATDKLTISVNATGGALNSRAPLAGGAFGNPVLTSYFILPSRNPYNPDGTWNLSNASSAFGGLHNTLALTEIDKRFLRETSLRGNATVDYKILQNLTFKTTFAADYNILEEDQYNNPFHGDGFASNGRSLSAYTRYMNKIWTNTLDWNQNLNRSGDLVLNLQGGYEAQSSKAYFTTVQANSFPATLELTVPSNGATPFTASSTISDYTFISYFSAGNLNFQDKYILSASFRRDGSSRFGPNNKYGNFWSVGGSWNIDREKFMENVDFISQLKLRASYGVNGNAGIGNYDWQPLYGFTGVNYNQQPGSSPTNVGDSNLTWELNKPFNVGVDVGLLNSRLNFSVEYYHRKSEDLLLDVPLSRTSGFTTAKRNIGAMENKGVEVTINATPVRTKDFSWVVDFNFANNKNKVTSLPNGNEIISGSFILREGVAAQTYYLRMYAGVDPTNGDPLWYTNDSKSATSSNYSTSLRGLTGNSLPKYFGSFTNSFNYKGFSFEAQLYYNFGNVVYDTWGGYYLGAGFGQTYNKVERVFDRWQKAGDVTDIPRYLYGGNKSFQSAHDFWLNKGDFIRLRNIQLGYNLPKSVVSKAKINNAFFYIRGTNLFTWVRDENLPFDPEQGTNSQTNLNVFIPKTITAGLNLSF